MTLINKIQDLLSPHLPDIWGKGILFSSGALDGFASYHTSIVGKTSVSPCGIEIKLPAEIFVEFKLEDIERCLCLSNLIIVKSGKDIAGAVFYNPHNLIIFGKYEIKGKSKNIEIYQLADRTLITVHGFIIDNAKFTDLTQLIIQRIKEFETLLNRLEYKGNFLKLAAKSLSVMKSQVYSPEGIIKHTYTTPDRWPHRGMWLWDSGFHSIGWRHINIDIAKESIEALFDVQTEDGMIPISYHHKTIIPLTQPPILSLSVKFIFEKCLDIDWLNRIYSKLCRYIEWDLKNRDSDGSGLTEWKIENNKNCRSGESGWDNSPRFDFLEILDAVDFNSLLALESEILAEFAHILNRTDDKKLHIKRYKKLCDLINKRLWNPETGCYHDYIIRKKSLSSVISACTFFPMIAGICSREQAKSLVEKLYSKEYFNSPVPVPTVSRSHPSYSKDMWRGPMWVNINWLIKFGLERYGFIEEAERIREITISCINRYYQKYGCLFEYYDAEDQSSPPDMPRKGYNNPSEWIHQCIHDYGWTATLILDMLVEPQSWINFNKRRLK